MRKGLVSFCSRVTVPKVLRVVRPCVKPQENIEDVCALRAPQKNHGKWKHRWTYNSVFSAEIKQVCHVPNFPES